MPGFVRSALLPDQEVILEEDSDVSSVADDREEDMAHGENPLNRALESTGRVK